MGAGAAFRDPLRRRPEDDVGDPFRRVGGAGGASFFSAP